MPLVAFACLSMVGLLSWMPTNICLFHLGLFLVKMMFIYFANYPGHLDAWLNGRLREEKRIPVTDKNGGPPSSAKRSGTRTASEFHPDLEDDSTESSVEDSEYEPSSASEDGPRGATKP